MGPGSGLEVFDTSYRGWVESRGGMGGVERGMGGQGQDRQGQDDDEDDEDN